MDTLIIISCVLFVIILLFMLSPSSAGGVVEALVEALLSGFSSGGKIGRASCRERVSSPV